MPVFIKNRVSECSCMSSSTELTDFLDNAVRETNGWVMWVV